MERSNPSDNKNSNASDSPLHIGAGIYDITGPAAEAGMFGYAKAGQLTTGIHMRLRSRAFAFHDTRKRQCKQQHFVFVSADIGLMTESVTHEVISQLQCHSPIIPVGTYSRENVMLSAVHTHCSPGGLSHFALYSHHPPLRGFDKQNFDCVVTGIVQSIVRAHANLQPGFVKEARGECIGASVNRSSDAYDANPKAERDQYKHNTDKEMVLWRLEGTNGFPIGMINWFAVHPTSMGNWYTLITGDNKGLASHLFERDFGTNHLLDKPRSFVAAFAQSNEGDVSPNVSGPRDGEDHAELGGDYVHMTRVANAQLETALALWKQAGNSARNTGPLSFKHQYVDYGSIELRDEWHSYKDVEATTSSGCIGISMLSGTQFDGKGLTIVPERLQWGEHSKISLCPNLQTLQKEKLIGFPTSDWGLSPSVLPLQLMTLGSSALAAIPFEATTMAGRRLRRSVTTSLASLGVTDTIIAGLSNAYSGYMTTREEYAVQRYEGASTHFGPNQLCATKQQFHQLAQAILADSDAPTLPPPTVRFGKLHWRTPVLHDGVLLTTDFGDVVEDVNESYVIADRSSTAAAATVVITVVFQAGHPKNDLRTQRTFLEVLRYVSGVWVLHADDGDENTFYEWERKAVDTSRVKISWVPPPGATPPGLYRIKHSGEYKTGWNNTVTPYIGYSSNFEIALDSKEIVLP